MGRLHDFLRELKRQMVREPLPPGRVAAGWALGMFVGCFVPFGLQLAVSVPLALWWRVSKIGATVATFVTNPVTIVFIYPAQCWVGSRLLGVPLSWEYLSTEVCGRLASVSLFSAAGWQTLEDLGVRVLGGFFAGGLVLALLLTPPTFFIVRKVVLKHRFQQRESHVA